MRVGDTAWNESPRLPVVTELIELSHRVGEPHGPRRTGGDGLRLPQDRPLKLVTTPASVIRPITLVTGGRPTGEAARRAVGEPQVAVGAGGDGRGHHLGGTGEVAD